MINERAVQHVCCTCSIWCDGVQFDCQRIVGVFVVIQSVAIAAASIEEPFSAEHRSVGEIQPQVLSHLTLLTLPSAGSGKTQNSRQYELVNVPALSIGSKAFCLIHTAGDLAYNDQKINK